MPLPNPDQLPDRPALPNALTMLDGSPVRTADDWYQKRRPELLRLFQHYVYGYAPPAPRIEARVTKQATLADGNVLLKEVEIRFADLPDDAPRIRLALFLPKERPAPVFLAINKCGNHNVVEDEAVTYRPDADYHNACGPKATEEARGSEQDFWCVDYIVSRGYGLATYHESDIDPDRDDFSDGIHPYYPDLPGPSQSHWGTIGAWAWGLQRAVDYLVTDPDVDAERIAVTGHSRRGKTALWAGAQDERIALVVPHQSGTGGCALSRNNDQEKVERINRVFPHWFNGMFKRFNNREEKLPIDQHLLIALVAPRPLLDTEGSQDHWANYNSALRALEHAAPVWELLEVEGLKGSGLVEEDGDLTGQDVGRLAQYRRDTKHTLNQGYWQGMLDFADRWLGQNDRGQ